MTSELDKLPPTTSGLDAHSLRTVSLPAAVGLDADLPIRLLGSAQGGGHDQTDPLTGRRRHGGGRQTGTPAERRPVTPHLHAAAIRRQEARRSGSGRLDRQGL